ncbi:branched-chain amino acid transport system permease protein [Micromonospora echinospora]|uniref:Branched-chain amino acid transport system permease protein n=1 Tax=Micromonospora echinospora TaxID=1877 RepID=A0ABR6M555_MICEC|nr:branched-chain amino acid ABC transporter permease [Micromonospora echinospora]MBB5110503.1 branched-chain amino acid transport system permease protein [Micromonospora echinospora]
MSGSRHHISATVVRALARRAQPWSALGLAAAVVGAVAVSPDPYLHATAARMLPLAVLAVSVAVVTGHAGLPTLGQVAPYAAGAYATARLALAGTDLALLHLLAAAGAGAVTAGALGALLVRYRATVFLMLSLAVAELTAITAAQWRTVSGGTDGLAGIPAPRLLPGLPPLLADRTVLLYTAAVAIAATAAAITLLDGDRRTLLAAVRANEARASASGHQVTAYLWTAHTGAGALAGIGGALLIHTHRWITPADVGFTTAALALLAVVIGGATSLPGAAAATVAVLAVRDVVGASLPGHAPLLLGALFVTAVYLLPGGLTALSARLASLPIHRRRPTLHTPEGPARPVTRSIP